MNDNEILDQGFDDDAFIIGPEFFDTFSSCLKWSKAFFAISLLSQIFTIVQSTHNMNLYDDDNFIPEYYKYYHLPDLIVAILILWSLVFFWRFFRRGNEYLNNKKTGLLPFLIQLKFYFIIVAVALLVANTSPHLFHFFKL